MSEQARRQQIMEMRRLESQARQSEPTMSDADALARVNAASGITRDQLVTAAMLGKLVQSNLNDIKKADVGGGLKVGDVDMTKVMPSGIAKAMGVPFRPGPPPVAIPANIEDPALAPIDPAELQKLIMMTGGLPEQKNITPVLPTLPAIAKPATDGQTEFDFNKQARYNDIMDAVEKLENRVIIMERKIDSIISFLDKKKSKTLTNGQST